MPINPERLKTLRMRLVAAESYLDNIKDMIQDTSRTRQLLRGDLDVSFDDDNVRRLEAIEATLQILRRDAIVWCYDLTADIEKGARA